MTHPSTRRAGADIDAASTALQFVKDARELIPQIKREGCLTPKARLLTLENLCAAAEECASRLMVRNGVGLTQTELDLGRVIDCRLAPPEDPPHATEQANG